MRRETSKFGWELENKQANYDDNERRNKQIMIREEKQVN